MDSRMPRFHTLSREARLARLEAEGWLTPAERALVARTPAGGPYERLVENVVGGVVYPVGVATNLVVNTRPRLVPMALEEPSVVAACSRAGLLARAGGGVTAAAGERRVGAHVLVHTRERGARVDEVVAQLQAALPAVVATRHSRLTAAGGGFVSAAWEPLAGGPEGLGQLRLVCDPADSMGANFVNDVAEEAARFLANRLVGSVVGAIVTNAPQGEPARATVEIPLAALATKRFEGRDVARRVELLSVWAQADRTRAVTHIKGILNGMTALMTALYQDTRALAAAVWAHAAAGDGLHPLATWEVTEWALAGRIEVPVVCGTVGGTGPALPTTALFLRWLGVDSARGLEEVAAAVGLVQNLAALTAIATEGIQKGHMRLHARKGEEQHGD